MLNSQLTASNVSLLALCGWREARSRPHGHDRRLLERAKSRLPSGDLLVGGILPGVILHPYQYSSFNHDDPNALLLPADPASDPSWADALQAAQDVYTPATPDPTLGATHYYVDGSPVL